MSATARCPQCGAPAAPDAPEGICPKCLMGLGLGAAGERGDPALPETTPPTPPGGRFTPPSPAELAEHFPQLEILGLIGHGGMGAVYKARQRELDRVVALKILPPSTAADPSFAERFSREARTLARMNHPHIVAVHDVGRRGGFYFFVMEYVDGVNLRQALQAKRLSPEDALAVIRQICEALEYAHGLGIVHRDIKPDNVLLDRQGRVKIADFGLAKLLSKTAADLTLTEANQAMGTPHYMAPEQFHWPLEVDHRADIYSLGVVFYELLTGELPIGRFEPPSKKVQVDVRLDEIVLRTLEVQPERRYQQAGHVRTDLDTVSQKRIGETAPPLCSADRPKIIPILAVCNMFAGLALLSLGVVLVLPEDPSDRILQLEKAATPHLHITATFRQLTNPLYFVTVGGLFAAAIGLFFYQPWARKLTIAVCVFSLAFSAIEVPMTMLDTVVPEFRLAENAEHRLLMGFASEGEAYAFAFTMLGILVVTYVLLISLMIVQIVILNRPRVKAALTDPVDVGPIKRLSPEPAAHASR